MRGRITITAYTENAVVIHPCKGTVGMAYKACQKYFGKCIGKMYDPPTVYWQFIRGGNITDVMITGDNVEITHGYRTSKEVSR